MICIYWESRGPAPSQERKVWSILHCGFVNVCHNFLGVLTTMMCMDVEYHLVLSTHANCCEQLVYLCTVGWLFWYGFDLHCILVLVYCAWFFLIGYVTFLCAYLVWFYGYLCLLNWFTVFCVYGVKFEIFLCILYWYGLCIAHLYTFVSDHMSIVLW